MEGENSFGNSSEPRRPESSTAVRTLVMSKLVLLLTYVHPRVRPLSVVNLFVLLSLRLEIGLVSTVALTWQSVIGGVVILISGVVKRG